MICEKCEALNALIDGYRRERGEARAEVERLRELLDENAYERGLLARRVTEAQARRDEARANASKAYRRGAEAMREACVRVADAHCVPGTRDVIRALPIPEEL